MLVEVVPGVHFNYSLTQAFLDIPTQQTCARINYHSISIYQGTMTRILMSLEHNTLCVCLSNKVNVERGRALFMKNIRLIYLRIRRRKPTVNQNKLNEEMRQLFSINEIMVSHHAMLPCLAHAVMYHILNLLVPLFIHETCAFNYNLKRFRSWNLMFVHRKWPRGAWPFVATVRWAQLSPIHVIIYRQLCILLTHVYDQALSTTFHFYTNMK